MRTANGTAKKVLKYVISNGTDIGDLHQTVKDKQAGKTHHVQAAEGSTSTIRDGKTVMYTESISGNLLGLIPITFDPENPPPLNIPLIYFTKVKVVQAGQFGGTLHVPGLHQFTTTDRARPRAPTSPFGSRGTAEGAPCSQGAPSAPYRGRARCLSRAASRPGAGRGPCWWCRGRRGANRR